MSIFTTPTQLNTENTLLSIHLEKQIQAVQLRKEDVVSEDEIILYVERPKESTKSVSIKK
jgi:hypothetical protein